MSTIGLLLVVVALAVPCQAITYFWFGANTDFNNPANWASQRNPSSQTCAVNFGAVNRTIVSKLDVGTYNMGSVFSLGMNSQLLLPANGLVLTFSDGTVAETCTSNWIGGAVNNQQNDLACHLNYQKLVTYSNNRDALINATDAVCQQDTLTFNATHTVKVWLGETAMGALPVNRIIANGQQIQSTANLGLLGEQFSLVDPSRILINPSTSECTYRDSNGNCVCFSSCPTPAMYAAQVAFLTGFQQDDAANQIAAASAINIVPTVGTFGPAALSTTNSILTQIVADPLYVETVMNVVMASFAQYYPGSSIVGTANPLTVNSNGNLVFSGTINSTFGVIGNITSLDVSSGTSLVQLAIKEGLTNGIIQATNQIQLAALPVATQNTVNQLVGLTNTPGDAVAAIIGSIPISNVNDVIANLIATGKVPTSVNTTALTQVINAIVPLCTPTTGSSCTNLQSTANTIQTNLLNTATPQTSTGTSPWVELLSSSVYPQATKVRNLDSTNAAFFHDFFFNDDGTFKVLPDGYRITGLELQLRAPLASARRRRSATNEYTMWGQFNYTAFCTQNSAFCNIANNGPVWSSLQASVNLLAASYRPASTLYFNATTNTYIWPVIQSAALNYCLSQRDAISPIFLGGNVTGFVYNIIKCGIFPTLPTGECLQVDPLAFGTASSNVQGVLGTCGAATTTVAPTTTTTTPSIANRDASTSGGGGGGSLIPIIAAVAGGALLVIIVVILLMKRRNKRTAAPAKRAADDRTVVAFENPMYDDPAQGGRQPVYDAAIGSGDHEGLYDEPAFAASKSNLKKENPLYSSQDNLDGGNAIYDNDNGGGSNYQDVNPGDGYLATGAANPGYLDTAPADPAYLDTHPNPDDKQGGGYLDVAPDTDVSKDTGYLDQ